MSIRDNLLIVSDLHLGEGWLTAESMYAPREDFVHNGGFFAFLRYHEAIKTAPRYGGRPWTLIFNGDTFDFVQVTALPSEGDELEAVCGVRRYRDLPRNTRHFGLGSSRRESVWKFKRIAQGHSSFFAALGWFIQQGNRILFIYGNHDMELSWPEVQDALREAVCASYADYSEGHGPLPPLDPAQVAANINFEPWFYYDATRGIYIEHGQQYEPSNHIPDLFDPTLPDDPERLYQPSGLLMTRYFYNDLEDKLPYSDNVRPATRAFAWMLSVNPLRGVFLFTRQLYRLISSSREIGRKQRAYRRARAAHPPRATIPETHHTLPRVLLEHLAAIARERARISLKYWGQTLIEQFLLGLLSLAGLCFLIAAFVIWLQTNDLRTGFLMVIVAVLFLNAARGWSSYVNHDKRLDYMPSVAQDVRRAFAEAGVPLRAIVLGHSHIPRRLRLDAQTWMVNTGAWIPLLIQKPWGWEMSTNLTFARVAALTGAEQAPEFLEWNAALGEAHYPNLPWESR